MWSMCLDDFADVLIAAREVALAVELESPCQRVVQGASEGAIRLSDIVETDC